MTVTDIREDVATANGYEVVTNPDGSKSSVPVTEEAKANEARAAEQRAAAAPDGLTSRESPVDGNCGSSWVGSTKLSNDVVAVTTGYIVYGAVSDDNWSVRLTGLWSSTTIHFFGGPNFGTKSGEGSAIIVGPGSAAVPTTAYAILVSGQVCTSGGPTSTFG